MDVKWRREISKHGEIIRTVHSEKANADKRQLPGVHHEAQTSQELKNKEKMEMQ